MSAAPENRQSIADSIVRYEAQIELSSALHPTNAAEQKHQFLNGEIENPVFSYRSPPVPTVVWPELAADFPLYDLYAARMEHTALLAALLQSVGDDEQFCRYSRQLFPVVQIPEPEQLHREEAEKSPLLNAQNVREKFEQALNELSLTGWQVEIQSGISSRMFVNQWKQLVGIRDDIRVTEAEADRLTKHEIGVHVLRSANGRRQTEPLLHVGTRRGRLFEEGVACYVENPAGPPRIFLRHHAVRCAQQGSFRDTWQSLVDHGVSGETAWSITLRVKRGLADTSAPGACTKDALYAQAFREMQEYMEQGGDLAPLLSAPIHPEEIEILRNKADMRVFPFVH